MPAARSARAARGGVGRACAPGRWRDAVAAGRPARRARGPRRRRRARSVASAHADAPPLGPHSRPELRHPHHDLGARAERRLDHQTVVVAERGTQPMIDIGQPDVRRLRHRSRRPRARRQAPDRSSSGSMPTPSSSTVITQSEPSSRATMSIEPPPRPGETVPHGVLHQRLQRQERHHDVEHLGRDLQLDLQRVRRSGRVRGVR